MTLVDTYFNENEIQITRTYESGTFIYYESNDHLYCTNVLKLGLSYFDGSSWWPIDLDPYYPDETTVVTEYWMFVEYSCLGYKGQDKWPMTYSYDGEGVLIRGVPPRDLEEAKLVAEKKLIEYNAGKTSEIHKLVAVHPIDEFY